MGIALISYCDITLSSGRITEEVKDYISKQLKDACAFNVEKGDNCFSFSLSGHNYINYDFLDEIRDYLREKVITAQIIANEYVESEVGYYWDSEDDEEE